MPDCQPGSTIDNLTRLRWWMSRRKLNVLFFKESKDLSIRAAYGNLQRSQFPLYRCLKIILEMLRGHLCSYYDSITANVGAVING